MREKLFLQIATALACLVPISVGLFGIVTGANMIGVGKDLNFNDVDLNSHFRYLSGLLLGIGICFLLTIPKIENYKRHWFLLTTIVFIGGLARLYGAIVNGLPGVPMQFGLAMELVVTPVLCFWQHRVARKF